MGAGVDVSGVPGGQPHQPPRRSPLGPSRHRCGPRPLCPPLLQVSTPTPRPPRGYRHLCFRSACKPLLPPGSVPGARPCVSLDRGNMGLFFTPDSPWGPMSNPPWILGLPVQCISSLMEAPVLSPAGRSSILLPPPRPPPPSGRPLDHILSLAPGPPPRATVQAPGSPSTIPAMSPTHPLSRLVHQRAPDPSPSPLAGSTGPCGTAHPSYPSKFHALHTLPCAPEHPISLSLWHLATFSWLFSHT